MKIGMVLDDTLDTPDGVQQYVLQVGRWFSAQGHDVHYLVGKTTRTDITQIHSLSRNMRVKFNGNRMSMPLPASRRTLRVFLREQQFDVLHVQVPYSPFLAGRLLREVSPATAVIGTFHILPYSQLVTVANRLLAAMNYRSAKRFDTMLAVSEPARDFAKHVYGYSATVLPNPVRLEQFATAVSTSPSLNIVFLGRLVERKGGLHLLRAIAYMRETGLFTAAIRVYIGGKGELLADLEQFAEQHNLTDIISFAGFISEADKAAFLTQADIAVYPSTGGESFGIVLLEAMAASRGVVLAGNNPGYASVMAPFAAQLIDPNDTTAFAQLIAHYLSNANARGAASIAQHDYVRRFDIGVVGDKLLGIYNHALQSRRQS
jgi:phosphatidylinositol alpha-mannosyltransferase